MATSGVVEIDDKLLKMIERVEKRLDRVTKGAKSTTVSIQKLFGTGAITDVNGLIGKLQNLERHMQQFANNNGRMKRRVSNEAKGAVDDINNIIKALQRLSREQDLQNRKKRYVAPTIGGDSFSKAMLFSAGVRTANEDVQAIQRLRAAKMQLSRTDDEYINKLNTLNSALSRHRANLQQANAETNRFRNSQSGLSGSLGALQSRLTALFGLAAIQSYIGKLVQIRKEFELQHRSLSILLQDRDRADKLWNQTVALAVQSPFRVKQLITYTKQLSAYRIETELLHDTTKRLADVSAGLGVDMQRLILAYGQVKAASFLRGTELRQFTEAGLPMLEELAKHFSTLEGEFVSVDKVFERISKRMVEFEDVANVFKNMTNEGGVFYKMQEEQSRTLHGMISNLYDSIDLMMNDIGRSNDSTIKGVIQTAKDLTENWRLFAAVLKLVGVTMISIQFAQFVSGWMAVTKAGVAAASAMNGAAGAAARLRLSLKLVNVLMNKLKAHPLLLIIGAVSTAIYALGEYSDAIKEKNKVYDEESIRNLRQIDELQRTKEKLEDLRKEVEANDKVLKDATSSEDDLAAARDNNLGVVKRLKQEYPSMFKYLVQNTDGTVNLNKEIETQNRLLEQNIALQQQAKGNFFQDDLMTNYQELVGAQSDVTAGMFDIKSAAMTAQIALRNAVGLTKEQYKAVEELLKNVAKAKNYEDVKNNMSFDYAAVNAHGRQYSTIHGILGHLGEAWDNLHQKQTTYISKQGDLWDNFKKQLSTIRVSLSEFTGDWSHQKRGMWVDNFLTDIGVADEAIRNWAKEEIQKNVTVQIDYDYAGKIPFDPKALADWQNRYNSYIKGVNYGNLLKEIKDPNLTREELSTSLKTRIDANQEIIDSYKVKGQQYYSKEEADEAEKKLKALTLAYTWLGNAMKETTKSGGKGKDWWLEMVNAVKNLHEEFLKLNEDLDETESKTLAMTKFKGVFDEIIQHLGEKGKSIDLSKLDFSTEGGMKSFLSDLKKIPGLSNEAKLAIENAISDIEGELMLTVKAESDIDLKHQVEKMFSDYEISLDLEELDFPQDLAKQLFNLDTMDLGSLRKNLEQLRPKFVGKKMEKEYEEYMKKVSEMEDKAQLERLKKYSQYLVKGMSERVKIKEEELRQIRKIEAEKNFTPEQKSDILRGVKNETKTKLDKLEWEDFKGSEMYQMVFQDLDKYSNQTISAISAKLKELKSSLKDLSPTEMKEIVSQIEKVDEIQSQRNPFKSMSEAFKEIKNLPSLEQLNNTIVDATNKLETNEKELQVIEDIEMARKNGLDVEQTVLEHGSRYLYLAQQTNEYLNSRKTYLLDINKGHQNSIESAEAGLGSYKKAADSIEASANATGVWQQEINGLFDGIKGVLSAAGVEADSTTMLIADTAQSMINLVFQAIQFHFQLQLIKVAAKEASVEINAMLGPIGWVILALQAVVTLFSAILGQGDKRKEKQIQALTERVKDLERAYENLEEATQAAYNIDSVNSGFDAMKANLQEQINATERMIQLEEDKKDTDHGRIAEWKREIADYRKQLQDLEYERINQLGGVAGGDAIKSASENFVNAWMDAFKETGDGLSGLEEQFDEVFMNLVKKQVLGRGVDKMLEDLYAQLDGMLDDGAMDAQEYEDFNKQWNSLSPQINEFLTNMVNDLGIADDITKKTGELSGLQEGISGITEDQADILAAYWSSVRFIVSNIEQKFTEYARQMLGTDLSANPILNELKAQTSLLDEINDKLGSIIGHSGGAHVKTHLIS